MAVQTKQGAGDAHCSRCSDICRGLSLGIVSGHPLPEPPGIGTIYEGSCDTVKHLDLFMVASAYKLAQYGAVDGIGLLHAVAGCSDKS